MAHRSKKNKRKDEQLLPAVNVVLAPSGDADNMTPEKLRSLFCNPIYAGLGSFPQLIDDETWVRAAARMIREEGEEQFLVNMLYVLRQSFGSSD
ncbi:MAG: hypothetical protein D6737_04970 [Chloroflexi bacterium]|nr:MAG: hypothetical protein CUN54_06645 [Phototrophicales bacterium]RMF81426.1 MAG: hypothetical protein D6737_04970 [Chloroflexota bacterium]